MDGLCLEPSCLREALRRPSGGSAEQTLHFLGSEDLEDRVHERGLTDAGTASNDDDTAGQRGLQRLPLARCERLPGLLLTPSDGFLKVDLRVVRGSSAEAFDFPCDAILGFPQVREEDQRFTL